MSYQVLARKWRPKKFSEVIGQQHVLQALINALTNNRLHHAYLFSGTRGVGKTTLARIFAKSLNCEDGITAEPCGVCGPCTEIDEGRFVDLIEVDAASRTKVEDTRELLENVQYAPSRGRFKVYLIDEVHMLSNHSFNALLKTLEEPPPHVKFLLATTDPQKLPVTVLSRCLQFNLMNMSAENIVTYLSEILAVEQISFENSALWQIGRAAEGSMRDALSLTDQAIAFSNGDVSDAAVSKMLGSLDRNQVYAILDCLVKHDAAKLLNQIKEWSAFSPDYHQLLTELLTLLHRVAVAQIVPSSIDNSFGDGKQVLEIASSTVPEDIQLYYQLGMIARRDLPLAPDTRSGFEMALLRMMVFSPEPVTGQLPPLANSENSLVEEPVAELENDVQGSQSFNPATRLEQQAYQSDIPTETVSVSQPFRDAGVNDDHQHTQASADSGVSVDDDLPTKIATNQTLATETLNDPVDPDAGSVLAVKEYALNEDNQAQDDGDVVIPEPEPIFAEEPHGETIEPQLPSLAVDVSLETVTPIDEEGLSEEAGGSASNINPMPVAPAVSQAVVPIVTENWPEQFWNLNLDGMTESIFGNSVWKQLAPGQIEITVDSDYEALYSQGHSQNLLESLRKRNQTENSISITFGDILQETPNMYRARVREAQRMDAVSYLKADPFVQQLEQEFGGRLDEYSIKPNIH